MTFPLRKIIFTIAIFIIFTLGCLLIFGFRQYQLQIKLVTVITQSEKMLFQFAAIREHIVESIVDQRYDQLSGVIKDVESLHVAISDVIANDHIPNEYKLSFLNRIDLQGLILLLRQTSSGHLDNGRLQQLNRESRIMNERFLMFDRVIVDYAKGSVIAFQSIVIGTLAIVVFVIVIIFVLGHRYVALPLLELVRQVKDVAQGRRNDVLLHPYMISSEVFNLGEAFHNLLQTRLLDSAEIARHNRILYAVHKAGLAISHARSRQELFKDVSRALRFNEDYVLIFISVKTGENGQLALFVVEEAISNKKKLGESNITALLRDGSESSDKINPAQRAIRENKNIVEHDILVDVPKGYFKDTPLDQETINCVALPLCWDNKTFGVITLYSGVPDSFQHEELKLLSKMASDVAFALFHLDMTIDFERERDKALAMANTANIMWLLCGNDGRLMQWDSNFSEFSGFPPDEIAGKRWQDFVQYRSDADKQAVKQFILSSEIDFQCDLLIKKKGGGVEVFRCRIIKRMTQSQGLAEVLYVCHNIAEFEQNRLSLELARSEQRLLFNAIPDMVFIISGAGIILDLNTKALETFKSERKDILGQNIFQYVYRDRAADYPSLLKNALREKKKASLRERFDNLAGEFFLNIVPLPVITGNETNFVLTVSNIFLGSDNRTEEVVRVFQLTNLGELATGVAHEINNLSNGIINYAQVLADESVERDCQLDPERMILLNKIISEGERIAGIVQKLLFYGREKGRSKDLISIHDVIEDVLLLVKHQFKNDGIKVDFDIQADLPPVAFESPHLQLILLNILNNSRRALNEKYSGKNENKRLEIKGGMEISNGKNLLKIKITDWGVGISPEIVSRIFDPIFTTKPSGENSGMGLAISRELLMKNNGAIFVMSEPGDRTTVTIELPVQFGQVVTSAI